MATPIFRLVRKEQGGTPITKRTLYDQLVTEGFSIPKIEMYSRPVYPAKPKYTLYTIYMMWYKYNLDPVANPLPPITLDECNAQWAAYNAAWTIAWNEETQRRAAWEQTINKYAAELQAQGFFIQVSNDGGAHWLYEPLTQLGGSPYTWFDMVYYLTWTAKLWKYSVTNQRKWICLRNTGQGTANLTKQPLSDLDKYNQNEIS